MQLSIQHSARRFAESASHGRIVLVFVQPRGASAHEPEILTGYKRFREYRRIGMRVVCHAHMTSDGGIGLHRALESPLSAEKIVEQSLMPSGPRRAYAVERTHYAVKPGHGAGLFKRLGVHFAYGLFVSPYAHSVTVALLVVEQHVLDVEYASAVHESDGLGGKHFARHHAVFAEILPVASGIRGTVYVRSGTV